VLCATAIAGDGDVDLNEILERHGIDRGYRQAFELIIQSGETISDDFRRRLRQPNFQRCADEVLLTFPQPVRYKENENGFGFHGA
jgi:hypothetical protein